MKKFENPTMDIEELKILDVITVSCGEDSCDDEYCEDNCGPVLGEWSLRKIFG